MYRLQLADCLLIFARLYFRPNIQASASDTNRFCELPLKTWVDLVQGG